MKLTPAMQQFMDIKNKHKDCIVFFRMGDFYETFFEDAKVTAKVLDIALTNRGKSDGKSIPLAGIPYHALDSYLSKMIKAGHKVAIVEQLEDPSNAKGIVDRGVVRIVTPGTVTEQKVLGRDNNFIASYAPGQTAGVALVDVSTGDFFTTQTQEPMTIIEQYSPAEIIVPMSHETNEKISETLKGWYVTYRSDVDFYHANAEQTLLEQMDVASLEGFGMKDKDMAIDAAGALVSYLRETQKSALGHINRMQYFAAVDHLYMDGTTIKNLELLQNMRDRSKEGTLLSVLDHTRTSMGHRLLKKTILQPLLDAGSINKRLNAVEAFISNTFILEEIKDLLKNIADMERLVSKVNFKSANPRDIILLQGSLEILPHVSKFLRELNTDLLGSLADMPDLQDLADLIDEAIDDEPNINPSDGNVMREGYNDELDELRGLAKNAKKTLRDIERREREKTGIKSLKVRYNKVFGYYIDVTKPNIHLVPDHYVKKQTLVNSERFITDELKELEEKILTAEEKIKQIEQELFDEILDLVQDRTIDIQKAAKKTALVDVIASFATVSMRNSYVKPKIKDNFKTSIKRCRHPVVELITDFVPNDVSLAEENRVMIITGPNMAGKSVFMRQVAINMIMAQMGCYVAADSGTFSIVDQIFCRSGAIDDISRGQSTFMVEMAETAQILNRATDKSFVILDEIGRGTSTYDGVAIAWAVAEYIAGHIKAKTLFATHYHVLNQMSGEVKGVKNYNIAVQEHEDDIVFLRRIIEGGTDKSYGVHVAKLAGMPRDVLKRSKEIQFKLENEDEIAEKIIVETRSSQEKDAGTEEIEEVDRLIKSKQMKLDDL